jgi:U4/U6.U5 tri-snRNP-associated protein 1
MAKGNERTKLAFQQKTKPKIEENLDEEPDDSFLNAALAKARRLIRLREMSQSKARGADAVAEAVRSIKKEEPDTTTSGNITFSIDDTREFTRAIRARAQQKERESQKPKPKQAPSAVPNVAPVKQEEMPPAAAEATQPEVEDAEEEEEGEMDIEELAKEVKTDDIPSFEGTAAEASGVGRGLSSFVSLLRNTGEISKKAAKEEVRGRAKDDKNLENYEPLDLSKVVKIGRNATDKDKELANREVKLEYRDKHGRLLTAKEAFRDLCYQFHGHGASKKKEEKRLKQITREQAEARLASRQVSAARDGTAAGTLGALKATQKATGKAFIVHKT